MLGGLPRDGVGVRPSGRRVTPGCQPPTRRALPPKKTSSGKSFLLIEMFGALPFQALLERRLLGDEASSSLTRFCGLGHVKHLGCSPRAVGFSDTPGWTFRITDRRLPAVSPYLGIADTNIVMSADAPDRSRPLDGAASWENVEPFSPGFRRMASTPMPM